jgi:hypothetical protein
MMSRTIYDLSETVMLVHNCTRRQAINFLNSEESAEVFFSDVQLTGYVSYPEDEEYNDKYYHRAESAHIECPDSDPDGVLEDHYWGLHNEAIKSHEAWSKEMKDQEERDALSNL